MMKKALIFLMLVTSISITGCYDDDILTSKGGEPIEMVTNLDASVSGNNATLSWNLPASYPEGIITPVSVQIVVTIDGSREGGAIVLDDNPTSYVYSNYDSSKEYRFTVKVMAMKETMEDYESDTFYSSGNTITL